MGTETANQRFFDTVLFQKRTHKSFHFLSAAVFPAADADRISLRLQDQHIRFVLPRCFQLPECGLTVGSDADAGTRRRDLLPDPEDPADSEKDTHSEDSCSPLFSAEAQP